MKTLYKTKRQPISKALLVASALGTTLLLGACSDNDDPAPRNASFTVEVTNLSAAQPLSPLALVLHTPDWSGFSTGTAASEGLELLAEGGDNSMFLSDAQASNSVYASASGTGIVGPGESESITIEVAESALGTLSFSVLSMFVNTNDAIAAVNAQSIAGMQVNDRERFEALSYDTGTEANSETADSMPGPAATGGAREGFNAVRDDLRDAVYVHAGVVTQDDGLASSALTEVHKWDHPAVQVRVERSF